MSLTEQVQYFENMPIPRFIVRKDAEDRFIVVQANNFALKYFGLDEEAIVDHNIHTFMSHENALHFQQCFEVCYQKSKSVSIQAIAGVPDSVRVYGFYISPIVDDSGKIVYLDVIGQLDLTDYSILQRERDDALSLMTSIFEVSALGILVVDHMGKIIRLNDSFVQMFGWDRSELLNSSYISLLTPDEREEAQERYQQLLQENKQSTGELKVMRKNGTIANVLYTSAVLELSQKRRYQVMTFMDITLRKQMEESLRFAKNQADAANRAKSSFLANMSHELRTPLNAIIGFSEMIMNQYFGNIGHTKYTEYITDIHSSAGHLLEIINEVLDMSKIEAGRIELDEEELDLEDLLKTVQRMMISRTFGSDIELLLDVQDDLPALYADHRLLRQVLINLITNAFKFSIPNGKVEIVARLNESNELTISIIDNGIGIPQDKIDQALQPFGQVSDSYDKTSHHGTGLGLPLAKAMIELHGGQLKLESDKGKGTSVTVVFPYHRVISRKRIIQERI